MASKQDYYEYSQTLNFNLTNIQHDLIDLSRGRQTRNRAHFDPSDTTINPKTFRSNSNIGG